MNSTHLSKRLQTVSDHVEPGSRLADIGSDHAYLPIHLAQNHIIDYGVVGEVAKGPLANATSEITKDHLLDILHPRLADGLAAIEPGDDIDAITIAGMGGNLITHIFEAGKAKLIGKEKLILQPNVGEPVVRNWLMANQYRIFAEQILKEDGHIYEIITAKKAAKPVTYSKLALQFGPFLLQEKSPVFVEKWQEEIGLLKRVIKNMRQATTPDTAKMAAIQAEIKLINEVIKVES
ncbi:tRNA (adenine(22)-N(1))-methyltransferase [Lentilactobacillus buchneri]|uniref:tRNA (adenine(22)-N(1))-methyltransferase n=1 Tax=Lentilactobacillus buchneri TaxID=1581 RepID=UPI001291833A|nr:tRNA (adenine(22)-N(1))-methyltransferase TrmK [Lentilactobacillus buchneri]MQM60435.1 tRNA (adenine(22)-N(1))-methyltransferase TrmK [Lentilactobacillus buchneri]MQM80123.1 tRNA (adenine(22)-N(1))-methyltransferase TrmK [Lentilactobacillus buchneri]